MTALNFFIEDEQICFAMDSLSVSADNKDPHTYLSKFIVLPHLSMAAAGTGHADFVSDWLTCVRGNIIAKDIDDLNKYVQNSLIERSGKFPELEDFTATVYHFGYSKSRKKYTGYAYRSTNNWESEKLSKGVGIKPAIDIELNDCEFPKKFIEIMQIQREEDQKLPIEKRVGIGGEIHFVHMIDDTFSVSRCFRFPSYERDYIEMCRKIN